MNSINLTGRLTADTEMRTTHSATAVTQFRWRSGADARVRGQDHGAVYIDVLCFDGLAESVAGYLENAARWPSPAASSSTSGRPTPAIAAPATRSSPD